MDKACRSFVILLCTTIALNLNAVISQEYEANYTNMLYLDIYIDKSGEALVAGYVSNESLAYLDFLKGSEYSFDEDENQLYAITPLLTYKFREIWLVNFSLKESFSEYDVTIYLPKTSTITKVACSPDLSYEISSEREYLTVEAIGFDVYAPEICVYYKLGIEKSLDRRLILLLPLIIAMILIIWKIFSRKEPKEKAEITITPEMEKVIETLSEKERSIIQALIRAGGKLKQNKLRIETGIPKSTLTMILRSLERKRIINKRKYGKTNIIELSEWFLSGNEHLSKKSSE